MEEQKEKYDEFLHDAYIYIVGPYNYTAYLAADGRSISTYYDALIGHMSKFLGEWEPAAYMAIEEATWGAQLRAQYETRMCTPESIRNTYPVSDETGQSMVQDTYDARDAYAEVISGEGSAVEEGLDLGGRAGRPCSPAARPLPSTWAMTATWTSSSSGATACPTAWRAADAEQPGPGEPRARGAGGLGPGAGGALPRGVAGGAARAQRALPRV